MPQAGVYAQPTVTKRRCTAHCLAKKGIISSYDIEGVQIWCAPLGTSTKCII